MYVICFAFFIFFLFLFYFLKGCGSKPMVSHFGVGEFTTHSRTYFSRDWDVHLGGNRLGF